MRGIVLYKSKYGNTLQYATWLSSKLGFALRDFSKFKPNELSDYDVFIFGSGVYMGKMNKIKKALKLFKNQKLIIFACAGNNNVEAEINIIKKSNFTKDELAKNAFFYLPGGVDFSKVKGLFKPFLNVFRKMLEKKKNRSFDEEQILKGFTEPTNYVDISHIDQIVTYINHTQT